MSRNKAQIGMTNYSLTTKSKSRENGELTVALRRLAPLLRGEGRALAVALTAIILNSFASLVGPVIIARIVDGPVAQHNFSSVLSWSWVLLAVYLVGLVASYLQTRSMGGVGRRVLFKLRTALFAKIQDLPLVFFNQNKAGDLISRINNDTDKLNQFFAQALLQFISNTVLILGAGIFLISLNVRLGFATLLPALVVLVITWLMSPWVERQNLKSLQSLGALSGEIQESLDNFKVLVAFNRLDYFRIKFLEVNERNYHSSVSAGIANNVFTPLYAFAYALGQLVALCYGLYLCSTGAFSLGLLIGFLLYVTTFYNSLRQLASVWSSLQQALAGLDRISEVLALENDMKVEVGIVAPPPGSPLLTFAHVDFSYSNGKQVLHDVSLTLEQGRTYALVGPTGGGKTTTALLMARLCDPTAGTVLLDGRDIRSYTPRERSEKIGFILQEPFLFTGTVGENIRYGNPDLLTTTDTELIRILEQNGLHELMGRFSEGLGTPVRAGGESVSLGQKQLIAFMRAALRRPSLLILDEATANIDTVTEQLLQSILDKLPTTTTRVIIAHRLNTIANADAIYFVNGGEVTPAGSLSQAVDLLLHNKRAS